MKKFTLGLIAGIASTIACAKIGAKLTDICYDALDRYEADKKKSNAAAEDSKPKISIKYDEIVKSDLTYLSIFRFMENYPSSDIKIYSGLTWYTNCKAVDYLIMDSSKYLPNIIGATVYKSVGAVPDGNIIIVLDALNGNSAVVDVPISEVGDYSEFIRDFALAANLVVKKGE